MTPDSKPRAWNGGEIDSNPQDNGERRAKGISCHDKAAEIATAGKNGAVGGGLRAGVEVPVALRGSPLHTCPSVRPLLTVLVPLVTAGLEDESVTVEMDGCRPVFERQRFPPWKRPAFLSQLAAATGSGAGVR